MSRRLRFFIKRYSSLILIGLFSFLVFFRLLRPGYFSMQDDTQIFRLNEFHQCLLDKQVPCRFIKNGGLGYGYPLFNFYSPLAYVFGEVFHLLGFSLINSVKMVFILGHLLAGFGMFFLARFFWGEFGGLLSSVLYLFLPYRAVNGFVRGAISEFWAMAIIPWLFWSLSLYLKKENKKSEVFFIVILFLFLINHNLSLIIFLPVLILFGLLNIFFVKKEKPVEKFFSLLKSMIISLGLASFFILPAFFESELVTLKTITSGYFDFRAHFVSLSQLLFSRKWGYGASLFGVNDDMSFQVGILHWLLPLISFPLLLLFKKRRREMVSIFWFLFFSSISLAALFLTHNKSTFIWNAFPFMAYFQFPWRFLALAGFGFSFCAGILGKELLEMKSKNVAHLLKIGLILLIIILNIGFFKEDIWFKDLKDEEKFSGQELIRQSGAGIQDYWPVYGETYPKQFAPDFPHFSSGQGDILTFFKQSNRAEIETNVFSDKALVVLPMVYFPKWQAIEKGEAIPLKTEKELGLISLELSRGNHRVLLELVNTQIRKIGNGLTLFFLFLFIINGFKIFKPRK